MILKNELAKEEKNRDESIDNFKNYLESEYEKDVIIEECKKTKIEKMK